jgi:hypothetical protein
MSDRKYGQRGYMQDERPAARPKGGGPPPPRDPAAGPRGRGLGAPTATVFRCASCGKQLELAAEVAPETTCLHCGADLHTCSNCVHFEPAVRNECRQGGATLPDGTAGVRVAKKTKRNECTLFAPKQTQEFAREATRSPAGASASDDPRAAFEALFKK